MKSKAIPLKRGFQSSDISVDQLFEAAFGPAPRDYRYKSLLGWRPLSPNPEALKFWPEDKGPGGMDPPSIPSPGVKVYETDELVVVEVELPPIEVDSLYLEISGDLLIIRANRLPAATKKHRPAHKKTLRMVHRYIQLPLNAKPGEVRARLEGDIVRVTIRRQNAK